MKGRGHAWPLSPLKSILPRTFLPLYQLHLSLLVRLTGDATGQSDWMRTRTALNALALLALILSTVSAVVRGKTSKVSV
jgi:hypothetical protein